jgi:hypothetical protein
MITWQDGFLIVLGLLACFGGYSMFRQMLPVWGFVLGGWVAYTFLPTIVGPERSGMLLVQIIGIGIGSLIGAAISIPMYYVIIFLSGGALGMMLGVMLGALLDVGGISSIQQLSNFTEMAFPPMPETTSQYLIGGIAGLILGGTAVMFQKFMICASSAFLGAAALITGFGGSFTALSASDMSRSATMLTAWLLLGLIGLFVQFRMMGEV